jgi:hypothetical protein
MRIYGLLTKDAPGGEKVRHPTQVWTPVRLRKATRCADCRTPLAKGTVVYAPITNALNRRYRMCEGCTRDRATRILGSVS